MEIDFKKNTDRLPVVSNHQSSIYIPTFSTRSRFDRFVVGESLVVISGGGGVLKKNLTGCLCYLLGLKFDKLLF